MKRVLVIVGIVAVMILPQVARGQTPGTRYGTVADCKQNVAPKGMLQYPSGVDKGSLAVKVDPDFQQKMLREERKIGGVTPVTPIYDLVVEAVPAFSPCYTDTPEKFAAELPESLPFRASIVADNQLLVGPGNLVRTNRKDATGRTLYEWKIKGWMDGVTSGEKLEKLIAAIAANTSIDIVVEVPQRSGAVLQERVPVTMSNCAPIWGSGDHKVIYERGNNAGLHVAKLIGNAEGVRTDGFEKIEPLKKYKKSFSHTVDLKNHDVISLLGRLGANLFPRAIIREIRGISSCAPQSDSDDNVFNYILYGKTTSLLVDGERVEGVASDQATIVNPDVVPLTVIHELGHFFGELKDEHPGAMGVISIFRDTYKNCSVDPVSGFSFEGKQYGEGDDFKVKGCDHGGGGVVGKNGELGLIYRPSVSSIMNYEEESTPYDQRFNQISCALIRFKIDYEQKDWKEYLPECAEMAEKGGVIKSTKIASIPPSSLLASMSNSISLLVNPRFSGASPVLAATNPSQDEFVIFERFTPPAAGVVWYDGEPMPPSLKFLEPDTASVVKKLRDRLNELTKQRDELRVRRDRIRGVWSVPTTPISPSPLLNAAPLRQQLGDISASLQSILEAMQAAVR